MATKKEAPETVAVEAEPPVSYVDSMEEYVEYTAPMMAGSDAAPDIVVGVNGELIRIKRGETVRIKRKFVEVLRNAQAQESEARRNRERERARGSARPLADM